MQGSFAAVFLMNLQPAVFGPEYYFVTTFIMLGSLIIGTALFLLELLVKYLHADVWEYCLVTAVILTMTIHFCYDPVESFYWYNGSIYYTFFYGLALILAAAVLCALRVEKVGMKVFLTVLSSVLCAVIGGGNYSAIGEHSTLIFASTVILFSALAVGNCTIGKGEDGETEILALPLGAEAAYELVSGEAADFREENRVRIELLENGEGEDVVLQSYSARQYLLFADDITTDPADWRNKALAGYYHCSSVVVEED